MDNRETDIDRTARLLKRVPFEEIKFESFTEEEIEVALYDAHWTNEEFTQEIFRRKKADIPVPPFHKMAWHTLTWPDYRRSTADELTAWLNGRLVKVVRK